MLNNILKTKFYFNINNIATFYLNINNILYSYKDLWRWLDDVAVPGVFAYTWDQQATHGYLVGMPRLRQIRSKPS